MTTLTEKMAALEEQLATQNTAVIAKLTSIDDTLSLLNTAIDTLNSNQSLNAQRLLAALGSIDPCKPCPTTGFSPPPLDVTPRTINADWCQRIQALLYCLLQASVKFDLISSVSVGFTPSLITDAWTEILTEASAGSSAPAPTFIEAATIVSQAIAYVAGNLLVGTTLQAEYIAHYPEELRGALYATDSAASAKSAYDAVVDGGATPGFVGGMLKAMGYAGLFNYFLDPANADVGQGSFDGSLCAAGLFPPAPDHCVTLDSAPTSSSGVSHYSIIWPSGGVNSTPYTSSPDNIWYLDGLDGYTVRLASGSGVTCYTNALGSNFAPDATPHLLSGTSYLAFVGFSPFSIELCNPAS